MHIGQLRELARLLSIQIAYEDAGGRRQEADADALLAAIRMRIGDEDPAAALADRRERFWTRGLEPVTVVWGSRRPLVDLHLPKQSLGQPVPWRLDLERGGSREGSFALDHTTATWDAGDYIGATVQLPGPLPFGYHSLHVTVAGRDFESMIIASPESAHAPRRGSWGIFAPVYAMRAGGEFGAGDLASLRRYREWIGGLGGAIVATLPMLAAFDEEPSPYSPVSRLFWNEMYLDLRALPELHGEDIAESARVQLDAALHVEYDSVRVAKRRVIEHCAERFTPSPDFEAFAERAAAYALFRAREERSEPHDRRTPSLDAVMHDPIARYHLYAQYRMAEQMSAVAGEAKSSGSGLYLDFPLGVHARGYDAWRYAHLFAKDVAVGAPPDLFFTKGQNWGFPPLDPDAIREDRYDYFRASVRHHMQHAGILRIDHVMGMHRLFWIPDGAEAGSGVYVRYAEEELYAILVLESHRHQCVVVGEDLGTVPGNVPRMMERHGVRRMYVVQYEVKPGALPDPPAASVASVNTHDMPSFAGFWDGRDITDRVEQGLLQAGGVRDEEQARSTIRESVSTFLHGHGLLRAPREDRLRILEGVLTWLAESSAEIVLVNLEDLWLEEQPQNVPGVPDHSWRQRFRLTLDEARRDDDVTRVLETIDKTRRKVHGSEAQQERLDDRNTDTRDRFRRDDEEVRRQGEAG